MFCRCVAGLGRRLRLILVVAVMGLTMAACEEAAVDSVSEPNTASKNSASLNELINAALSDQSWQDPRSPSLPSPDPIRGLEEQMVNEILTANPGTFCSIRNMDGVDLHPMSEPASYAHCRVKQALESAVNYANYLRTTGPAGGCTQPPSGQLELYWSMRTMARQWFWREAIQRSGSSGIAAAPNRSHHLHGQAIDLLLRNRAEWHCILTNTAGFRWFGPGDEPHYDFVFESLPDLRPAVVSAFQRLHDRNRPNNRVRTDGVYDDATAQALADAPGAGF